MGTLAQLLLGLAGPIAIRVLTALGISTLTFTGVAASLQGLISMAQTNWGGMPADVLALSGVVGVPQGLGIIAGAMTARVGMWVAVSATKFVLGA